MTNRDIRKAVKPLREKALTEAARLALEEGASTWQALRCASQIAPSWGHITALSWDLLDVFRRVFASEERRPDDDCETRCLAFLFLNEILKDHTK